MREARTGNHRALGSSVPVWNMPAVLEATMIPPSEVKWSPKSHMEVGKGRELMGVVIHVLGLSLNPGSG